MSLAAARRCAALAISLAIGGCAPGPSDASSDAGGPSSAAIPDGGADVSTCHPTDVSGFQPPTRVPTAVRSLACDGFNGSGGLVETFRDACLQHAPAYPPCAAFAPGDAGAAAACYSCLVSPTNPDGTNSGVVGFLMTVAHVNYPTCIQTVDPSDAGAACALALLQAVACAQYACKSTCPVSDESSVAEANDCINEATSGACLGYALQSNACLAQEQGDGGTPVAQICFPGSTPEEKYLSFAHYLCGEN